jgi:cholesterol oxidase
MPWFSQGIDAADGVLELKRPWWLFGPRRLNLRWDITRSLPMFEALVSKHQKLAKKTGAAKTLSAWPKSRDLITPHALGGCNMGDTPQEGVVNHLGEVFGHRNLFVADGAIIPTALGVNPRAP